jgi:hypothetical protein
MRIEVDGGYQYIPVRTINWQPPPVLAKNGDGAPILGPYWTCYLSLDLTVETAFADWLSLRDSELHTFDLPHPGTGIVTSYSAYVDISDPGSFDVSDGCSYMAGFDITLSRITVT